MAHVGIDLGTTNSLVAFLESGRPRVIPNAAGQRTTPSIVGLDASGRMHVGASARNQLVAAPERTIAEVKRLMGGSERVTLGERDYSPTEISAVILRTLKDDAERFFATSVAEAVITVPAYFTDAQRQATKDAGELAGLRVERIVNEPTAAALAYGIDHLDKEQHVLVYDLGGGTFDVSVLEMFDGVLDVKASAGNNRLGGGDFDRTLAGWLRAEFERRHGIDLSGDARAAARLKTAAEQAKIDLSASQVTTVLLPFLAQRGGESLSLEIELTRQELERLIGPMVRSTLEPIASTLADAKLDRRAVTEVVLVGGSTRVPMVRQLVAEYFGKEPITGVDVDEAVALGAAIQAGLKSGAIAAHGGIMITDVCPFTLGVEVSSKAGSQRVDGMFSPIIARNSTVPVSKSEIYATTADNQRQVTVRVFQGESSLVKNNVFLDAYSVEGIPPALAGRERVSIAFTYDVNGILEVATKVLSTGKEAVLRIEKSPNRMTAEERHAAKERLDRELAVPPPPLPPPSVPPTEAPENAILEAARARLATAAPDDAAKLRRLIGELAEAIARGDVRSSARLDAELTDLLVELP